MLKSDDITTRQQSEFVTAKGYFDAFYFVFRSQPPTYTNTHTHSRASRLVICRCFIFHLLFPFFFHYYR